MTSREGVALQVASLWRLGALVLVMGLGLSASGCKDEGRERFLSARARYEALLAQGVSPHDPAFDEVLAKLDAVPEDSKARAEAKKLAQTLRRVREVPVRPLAVASGESPDAGTTAARCEALARQLGLTADEDARAVVMEQLVACRQMQDREHAHTHAEPTPGAPGRLDGGRSPGPHPPGPH